METAVLVGSYPDLPDQTLEINGAPEALPLPTHGSVYLYDSTSALSLLSRLQSAMVSGGIGGASAVLLKNGKVRLSGFAPFTLDWPADNLLRDLLGFDTNLAAAGTYTAANVSPLLWVPYRLEQPMGAPLGTIGHKVNNTYTAVSPRSGRTMTITHGSRTYNEFRFPYVDTDLIQTASEEGGEWVVFYDNVCSRGFNMNLWRNVDMDPASGSAVSWTSKLGPYVFSPERRGADWQFVRSGGLELTEVRSDLSFRVHVVPEYA